MHKSNSCDLLEFLNKNKKSNILIKIIIKYLNIELFGWFPRKVCKSKYPLAVEVAPIFNGEIIVSIKLTSNLIEKCIKAISDKNITKKIFK